MPSDSELRSAVTVLSLAPSGTTAGDLRAAINVLLSLAETHLSSGVEGVEKRRTCKTCDGVGWWAEQTSQDEQEQRKCPDCEMGETSEDRIFNDALAAVKMAGYRRVPSVDEVKKAMKTHGGDKLEDWLLNELATAVVEAWEGK